MNCLSPFPVSRELHGERGLGKSNEALAILVVCAPSWCRDCEGQSLGDETDSLEGALFLRASKCDRREETGFWRFHQQVECVP
jgi:hypothetical protein